MKILCTSRTQLSIPINQYVNKVGKYVYKYLDGAYNFKTSSNMYDVYTTLLYELRPEYGGTLNDVQEMTININITTYQNKLRINTIELTPQERTLGYDLLPSKDLIDMKQAYELIMRKVANRIRRAYGHYNILF